MLKKAALGCALIVLAFVLFFTGALVYNVRTPPDTDYSQSRLLLAAPEPLTEAITLKAVTFNVQDLGIVSKHRPERMAAIARTLRKLDPGLVGIQESFIEKDRAILIDGLRNTRLIHHRYFPSGTSGSGLLILSAYPIVEAYFHRYTKNGKWYKLWHGDWWAGKGVALAQIELVPGKAYLDFYNTHAHARYGTTEYDGVRLQQMEELAEFINATSMKSAPAILVGDMNCRQDTEQYEAVRIGAGLVRLMTIDSRIDHIFGVSNPRYTFETISTEEIDEAFTLGEEEVPLSDHKGYISTIRIAPVGATDDVPIGMGVARSNSV